MKEDKYKAYQKLLNEQNKLLFSTTKFKHENIVSGESLVY